MNITEQLDQWNSVKKKLIVRNSSIFFSEREVWWCSLGKNIGDEQDGKNQLFERPVLVLRKFNKRIFLAIPLSTKVKENRYCYLYFSQGKKLSAILSQVRLLDSARLQRKMGLMSKEDFLIIKQKVKEII